MKLLSELGRFVRNLFRPVRASLKDIEDSPELEMEKERRRGMRGDAM